MLKPQIDTQKTLGAMLLLIGVTARYETIEKENGGFERTNKILGWNYTVICLEKQFEKITVKTEETIPLFEPKEVIPENTLVSFQDLIITPWVNNKGWIQLSVKATKCKTFEEN